MSIFKVPVAALASLLAGVLLLASLVAPVSAHEGYGSVTRWQYFCVNGTVEVTLNNYPRTFVWNDIKKSSHNNDTWGAGYTTSKTLTEAKGWCRSRMVADATAKCQDRARMFGASSGSWWFETTAHLYKASWRYYDYYDSYGYHARELHWPVVLSSQANGMVVYSGTCSGPSQPL